MCNRQDRMGGIVMSKYIDAEKLMDEIDSRIEDCKLPNGRFSSTTNIVRYEELSCLRNFVDSIQQEQPDIDLAKFTEKIDSFIERYKNNPERVSIKGAMAFMARMFYQYPFVAREWYEYRLCYLQKYRIGNARKDG